MPVLPVRSSFKSKFYSELYKADIDLDLHLREDNDYDLDLNLDS